MRALLRIKVRPYYLFHCDPVIGAGHFRTSVWKGLEIMEGLRGHMSRPGHPDLRRGQPARRRQDSADAQLPRLAPPTTRWSCGTTKGMLIRYQAEDKPAHDPSRPPTRGVSALLTGAQVGPDPRRNRADGPATAVPTAGTRAGGQRPDVAVRHRGGDVFVAVARFAARRSRSRHDMARFARRACETRNPPMHIGITFDLKPDSPMAARLARRLGRGIRQPGHGRRPSPRHCWPTDIRSANWATAGRSSK